jgi:hypothetical protein
MHAAQAMRTPDGPTDVPGAQHVGLKATVELGGRSQSVALELSLSRMASRQAPVVRCRPELG